MPKLVYTFFSPTTKKFENREIKVPKSKQYASNRKQKKTQLRKKLAAKREEFPTYKDTVCYLCHEFKQGCKYYDGTYTCGECI